jgi:hypothetical protein
MANTRDTTLFPNDPIGDQLWDLACAGAPVSEAREITFVIDFPTITSVAVFMEDLEDVFSDRLQDRIAGQTLSVTLMLVPDHATVSAAVAELEHLAAAHDAEMLSWAW